MPYTGAGKNTYWGSIGYNGVSNPTILSEFIPVVTDSTTTYKFEVTACISTATWGSGYSIVLNFYQADRVTSTGSTTTVNSGSLSAGILVQKVTSAITAPANSAYCQASLQLVGAPATTNLLQVFEAQVLTGSNTAQPVVVNANYAFIHSADPWTSVNSALIDWNISPLTASDGDFDSLVIDNIVELMGGTPGVQSFVPECIDPVSGNGAIFKIAFPGGSVGVGSGQSGPYDLGAPQPTTDAVESLLLDGERPFGTRASNREMTLPVVIFGPTLNTMVAARELLLRTVDQQTWKLTWKPASSGLPLEFDCFRAHPSVVTYGFGNNDEAGGGNNPANWAVTVVTLTFQALPYGRSGEDGLQQIDFLDGILDAGTITPQVTLDRFFNVDSAVRFNDLEGGTNGTTVSIGNSGTANGHSEFAFTNVAIGTGASLTYSNAQPTAYSNLCASVAVTGTSTTSRLVWSSIAGGPTTQWFRFYVYLTSNPVANISLMDTFDGASSTRVNLTSAGKLSFDTATATGVIATTNSLPLNQWVRINGFVTSSTTVGQVGFSFYSSTESTTPTESVVSTANKNTGSGPITLFQCGITVATTNYSYLIDNIVAAATADPGAYTSSDNPQFISGGWSLNTAYAFGSSQSVMFSQAIPVKQPWPAAVYTKAGAWNLTKLPILTAWLGQSYDTQWTPDKNFVSNLTLSWTLTDVNGKKLTFSGTQNKCKWGPNPGKPAWTRIAATIPQGKTKAQFDYSRVIQYSVRITNWHGANTSGLIRMHAWLSQIVATATTAKWIDTPHAHIYSVFGLANMARTTMSAEIQLPATNPITHELTQTNTWTVPKGVTQVAAECWGGGGGGGSVSGVTNGLYTGGGGGGEYAAEPVVTVIPGTAVPFTIGSGGIGGQVVQRTSTFTTPGSNNWTCPTGVTVITCKLWGGGAAGAAGGGGGGGGAYTEGTVNVTAGTTYNFTVGKGGVPNSGKLSKDQALRHGGDTIVRGDSGALHAHGGSSAITGGTSGGIGGTRITSPESGTTITSALNGGNGGNSPGSAGGGGGASGNNTPANGNRGGDSPKGANNYGSGGPGGIAAGNGGAGGAGANLNGQPVQGVIPGGAGGGGFTSTSGTNNNGAYGANGVILISYQQNAGNPINGGTTTFGQSGLTNKIVTAHGGSSPALSSATGGGGGTGSANTTHFNGGSGAMSGNNSDYLFKTADLGGPFTKLGQATATATTVTTGASALSLSTGIAIVSAVTSVVLDPQATVTDSAGNTYDFVANQNISGTVTHYLFMSQIGVPITGSTTLTLANNGVSATMTVSWMGSVYYADIDQATVQATGATSTTPGISSFSNANTGTHMGYLAVVANNSTTVVSAAPANPGSFASTTQGNSETSLGTADICWLLKEVPGASSGTAALTATYGGSVAWSGILLPLVPQDSTSPTLVKMTSNATTGTSIALSLSTAFPVGAGTGYGLLYCQFAGTPGTVTFTDASGNTWTQRNTVTIGTSVLRAYTSAFTNAYTTASTITLNDTTSQAHVAALYFVPGTTGPDTSLDKTATGTSSAPAITLNSGTEPNDFEVIYIANNNTVDTTSTPGGWVPFSLNNSGTMHGEPYAKRISGRSTATVTSAYLASQTWGIIAVGFKNNVFSGSGGASGGPMGVGQDGSDNGGAAWSGGGKGADGITGSFGNGQPAAIPGGGGSGSGSTDTASYEGGSGGSGIVRLTWQPPLTTFNDFILHRPGVDAKKTLCPVVTIPPNDPPDNREYGVPSLIPGVNAEFWGTYSVLVVANAWNSTTTGSSRRLSVTINQYEYKNGPVISAQCTRVVTPATDIVNGYVSMGEVTLPIKDYDPGNDEVYYTISIHDTDQADSFQDVIFLDNSGQTVLCNIAPGTAADHQYSSFYVNEPTFDRALGQVLGSRHGREKSVSVLDMTLLTGGPLYVDSGDNLLLAYSTSGAPNLGVTYQPKWYTDRTK